MISKQDRLSLYRHERNVQSNASVLSISWSYCIRYSVSVRLVSFSQSNGALVSQTGMSDNFS